MTRIIISEEAFDDLNDAYWFYESQEAGVGDHFANCLRTDIDRLSETAGSHRTVYRDYHHAVSLRFPFGIYYTFDEAHKTATVWAIIDLRQDPQWIEQSLMNRPGS